MKALVVGCGSIGRRHGRNLRAQGLELLCVDSDGARAKALAAETGGQVCATMEDALSRGPEVAFVATPSSLHVERAILAIEAGCDVFVEKPLAHEMKRVAELKRAAERHKRIVMTGFNLRFHPVLQQAKRWLEEGAIGRVLAGRLHVAEYLPTRHPGEDYRQTYAAQQRLGGGIILDAIHEVDYCVWFLGMPQTVFSICGTFSDFEMDAEDTAEIVLGYDRSVVSIHMNYVQRPRRRWCELAGSEGTITCDLLANTARLERAGLDAPELFAPTFRYDELYVREAEHFLQCVRERGTPAVDIEGGARSLLIAEAAKQSGRTGRQVHLATASDGANV